MLLCTLFSISLIYLKTMFKAVTSDSNFFLTNVSMIERLHLMLALDKLVRRNWRGTSADYARKLNISRSSFFRLLDDVRDEFQAPLVYNKRTGKYEYKIDGRLTFRFLPMEALNEEALKKIEGGSMLTNEKYSQLKIFSKVPLRWD